MAPRPRRTGPGPGSDGKTLARTRPALPLAKGASDAGAVDAVAGAAALAALAALARAAGGTRLGPGTFTTARADPDGDPAGHPYRVEVEDGSGVDPDGAAVRVAEILADERGWARDGRTAFRRVADDSARLVIPIATPGTTDRLCAAHGTDIRRGGQLPRRPDRRRQPPPPATAFTPVRRGGTYLSGPPAL